MTIRWLRLGTTLFFVLFVLAVTWPGMILFNRVFPLVLGLPFNMVWIASWVLASFFVILALPFRDGRFRRGLIAGVIGLIGAMLLSAGEMRLGIFY